VITVLLPDSVILLDPMSSDEETLEDSGALEDTEAKERTDRLMSMAEYRNEIYAYLRKSEVCFCFEKFVYFSVNV